MYESQFIGAAKGAAYALLWIAAAMTLFRGVVGPLWGSASDYGLFGAVAAAAFGVLGLAWVALVMFRDVAKHFQPTRNQ